MNNNDKIIEKINKVLDELRPYIQQDGGDIELIDYKDGIAYVNFEGSCKDCPMKEFTLNDGIKETLINEIEEVIDVRLV